MAKKKNDAYEQLSIFDLVQNPGAKDPGFSAGEVGAAETEAETARAAVSMDLPLDWENFYDSDVRTIGVIAESISDGLIKCLNVLGKVDIEYIASITGEEYKTVIDRLRGSIYQNPDTWDECFYQGWETAEEYLSGNIAKKLKAAEEANEKYNGYFQTNIDALSQLLPRGISIRDIYVTLGSPWVPTHIIEEFIDYLQGRHYYSSLLTVKHEELTGTWEIVTKYRGQNYKRYASYEFEQRFGTSRWKALELLLRTLNMQSVAVYDTVLSPYTKSGKQKLLNKDETVMALDKQRLLIDTFRRWVWNDTDRARELKGIYEERFLSARQRYFDGSFLELPGLNPTIELYPYQKNAVARILFSNNTLLAHDVGSGKTYVMIAAGMELKRLGLSKKNLYVVPNNIIGQWREIFSDMYPEASLLIIDPKSFKPGKREEMLNRAKSEEFDGIIIAYSCFTQIPVSKRYRIELLRDKLQEAVDTESAGGKGTKQLSRQIDIIKKQIWYLSEEEEEDGICFDELGITGLFVDEAHNFKNVPITTKIENVMGISAAGSKKCEDMMRKVRMVQRENGGRGVVFATGTPITNSITDAFIMQSYLQSGTLKLLELQNFDSWIGMFAEKAVNFEIDVDTSSYRMATRFSEFHNIPELTAQLAQIADFHQLDNSYGIPSHDGYRDVVVKKTRGFNEYLKLISERADRVRRGRISRTEDNMLKITTDGRKAALDLRLVDKEASFTTVSKVFSCAENIERIYGETGDRKSTQLVFCDTSTPKAGFNIYDELKGLLIKMGIPAEEIAFIHDAGTEAKREKLFSDINNGRLRVLIGSTFKLGLGVNVQNKLIALHHLDVPWRPADMVQREGRILRQGNENTEVFLYRYITEGSFDAYSWQLLETKQRFIADLLSGTAAERQSSDIDDTVLNYAEVKALAVGDPMIRERVETANELSRLMILQQKYIASRLRYEKELKELPEKMEKVRDLIPKCEADLALFEKERRTYTPEERRDIRQRIYEATHTEEPLTEETFILSYQGFQIIAPARVSELYPVVWVKGSGCYSVELTDSDIGSMGRIDRTLEDLENRLNNLKKTLSEYQNQQDYIQEELAKDDGYTEDIEACREHLRIMDQELGIKQE